MTTTTLAKMTDVPLIPIKKPVADGGGVVVANTTITKTNHGVRNVVILVIMQRLAAVRNRTKNFQYARWEHTHRGNGTPEMATTFTSTNRQCQKPRACHCAVLHVSGHAVAIRGAARQMRIGDEGMADEEDKQDKRDQANRIFEHGLHEDDAFTERGNYFLIAESMLVVAYAGLLSSGQSSASAVIQQTTILLVARILASFGFLLTVVWIYVNQRQWQVVRHLQERTRDLVPEYKVTYETRPKRRISSTWLMAYFVPALIGVMWAIFIFVV